MRFLSGEFACVSAVPAELCGLKQRSAGRWLAGAVVLAATGLAGAAFGQTSDDAFRPGYHFTAEKNWINDPNGLIYIDGTYHLYFQHNPLGNNWGNMSWGHATSTDLVHWDEQPIAIHRSFDHHIFSGTVIVDEQNVAGFGAGAMLAFYTGWNPSNAAQDQRVAYSTNGGQTFTKYMGNPLIPVQSTEMRDPAVFWHEPTSKWVMAVSRLGDGADGMKGGIAFYASTNLKDWSHESTYGTGGKECPDLFQVAVDGDPNRKKWVLMNSANAGVDYHVGEFDGSQFNVEFTTRADHGQDFYAAQEWNNLPASQNRNVVIGWMGFRGGTPTDGWRGMMSIPREVSLHDTGNGLAIRQQPARELESLRVAVPLDLPYQSIDNGLGLDPLGAVWDGALNAAMQDAAAAIAEGNDDGSRDQLEIVAHFDPLRAERLGLKVRVGEGEQTLVGYDVINAAMFVDRSESGIDYGDDMAWAPLELMDDGTVKLHVFVDASSVEVFGNDGQRVITSLVFPDGGATGLGLFAEGGTANLLGLSVNRLAAVPEPAGVLGMALLGVPTLLGRRRRG